LLANPVAEQFFLQPDGEFVGHHQPVNPPAPPDLSAADARVVRAVEAWKSAASEATRVELGQSVAEFEKLTGELWSGLKPEARAGFGLADRPGELDRAS
jgi:hypothetical protein